jgi:putative acetyltransferase
MLRLIRTDSENVDFQSLVVLLNEALAEINGDKNDFFMQFNRIDSLKNVVLAYQDEVAVGCGAFKQFDDESVEIKRMFVNPNERRMGIAVEVLKELEAWANEIGYKKYVLETSKVLIPAVRLYQKSGYQIIPNYGQYIGVENSVCMKKISKM